MKIRVLILSVGMIIFNTSCFQKDAEVLTIAAAANIQFALEALCEAFTVESSILCRRVISSSGMLTAQIMEGATYDVFLSADMSYPEYLFKNGQGVSAPEIYAFGALVLWTNQEHLKLTIPLMLSDSIKHIAIANPETAPYGKAALTYLKNSGIYEAIQDKLVFGSSISQTNQFVYSGAADLGFTAKSVVYSPKITAENWIEPDTNLYLPIEQGILLLKNGSLNKEAQAFRKFLFSQKGKEILTNFGYQLPQ